MHYTVEVSKKLEEFASQFTECQPGQGGLDYSTEADDLMQALYNVIDGAPVEMSCDLTGEWIRVTEKETGSELKHNFTRNPNFRDYLGSFEFEGMEMKGEKEDMTGEEGDVLPTSPFCIRISVPEVRIGDETFEDEEYITEFMPDSFVQALLADMKDTYMEHLEMAEEEKE